MKEYYNIQNRKYFYHNFQKLNPLLFLFLIVITFGFYLIEWFYQTSKIFEILDDEAFLSERVFFVIFLFPTTWYFINYFSTKLGFVNLFIDITERVVWAFLIFLIIKFLYDFACSFGRITETYGLFWFFILLIPILGVILIQLEINHLINKIEIKKKSNLFYS